jgi:hypothetical protein
MLSSQAKTILVFQLFNIIISTYLFAITKFKEIEGFSITSIKIIGIIVIIIALTISTFLTVLGVNCMTNGSAQCNTISWVIVGFLITGIVFSIMSSFVNAAYSQIRPTG